MNDIQVDEYFRYHNENIKLIKVGFNEIRNQIKSLYKRKSSRGDFIYLRSNADPEKLALCKLEKSYYRILSGMQVSWAEESIKRLWYERGLFTDSQREYLLNVSPLDQKWFKTLKLVFCISYDLVPLGDEICEGVYIKRRHVNLNNGLISKYDSLRSVISEQLVPNFNIRNKVQHGEWVAAFRPKNSAVYSHELSVKVDGENIVTTSSRFTIVNALYQMLVDMGRFNSNNFSLDSTSRPFEYFFSKYMRKIVFEVEKISNPNLDAFIDDIVQRASRGENAYIRR